jgi:hypothetical protein
MDNEKVTKDELLKRIKEKHAEMEKLLASLDKSKLDEPGVYGELSVKDVLSHLTAWERMMLGWLESSQRGEKPVRFTPEFAFDESGDDEAANKVMDNLNEHIFRQNKGRTVADVMADFEKAHADVVQAIEAAPEADLIDPNRFPWRNGYPFWPSVVGNTYGHYEEHIDLINQWLAKDR